MKKIMKLLFLIATITVLCVVACVSASALDATGQCGENVFWTFDEETGVLTVSGNGNMYNYDYFSDDSPFQEKSSIKIIKIENNVTSIGQYAFYGCINLKSVTISDSVVTIGDKAFGDCNRITDITIPDSVKKIGNQVFYWCNSLETITVDADNMYYSSDNSGVLFNKDKTLLIHYPMGNERTNYIIPGSVTTIDDGAFWKCSNLTNVVIPDSVTDIGAEAFWDCVNLKNIILPDSVINIGEEAFWGCESFTEELTIPNGVINIGDGAFWGCRSLTDVIIGKNVKSIGNTAFSWCFSLKNITVNKANLYYYSDDNGVLFNKDKTVLIQFPLNNAIKEYTIPDSVTSICEEAFFCARNLRNITIPDSVTDIGISAFDSTGYYNNESNWENGVLYINKHLISMDSDIENYAIKPGTLTIADNAFAYKEELTNITIPDSVTSIGKDAFIYCRSLADITIPESVVRIGNEAFYGCENLTEISADENNEYFSSDESGILFDKNKSTLICYPSGKTEASYVIPAGVIAIGYAAFGQNNNLKSITISDGVTSIGDYAFWWCENLSSVIIPNGVTSIGVKAFYGCERLTDVIIPDSVRSIGDGAFYYCYGIESITIPYGVTNIGDDVFWGCDGLVEITIPDSVRSIGDYAFWECGSLTDVYYGGNQEQWNRVIIGTHNGDLIDAEKHFSGNPHTHFYTSYISVQPTCTENGRIIYTCSCEDSYSEVIYASGHTYGDDGICDNCNYEKPAETLPSDDCNCNCHKKGISSLIWKILRIFYRIFRINPVCSCGVAHY